MNAVILAAGLGTRLTPLTSNTSKALVRVSGQPIIERQIEFLLEKGISEISIVIGYLGEQFEYLIAKYGVNLIFNQFYNELNNIYSMFLARNLLGDTYVLEGDVYLTRNFLKSDLITSTYFTGLKDEPTGEWLLTFEGCKLKSIIVPNNTSTLYNINNESFIMSGVSFWNKDSSFLIKRFLEDIFNNIDKAKAKYKSCFWDQIIVDNLNSFDIYIQKISSNDWFEIDRLEDLLKIESNLTYIDQRIIGKGSYEHHYEGF